MTQAAKQNQRWRSDDSVPTPPTTPHFILEPLHEKHAKLDFAALMSCRQRLRNELQWGEWPPRDFTLSRNRADLRDHYGEFVRGEAFAYTVLQPDQTRCLGCIYLERFDPLDGAQLAFWVIDGALDIETMLVKTTLNWAHSAWGIEHIAFPFRPSNVRGIALAESLGLVPWDSKATHLANHRCLHSISRVQRQCPRSRKV